MNSSPTLRILPDRPALFHAAANEFIQQANAAIRSGGRFAVALAGGSTPRGLFNVLAKNPLPWDKIYIFFGDERHVPPDDPESNYRMARESLLAKAPIPAENVFRIPAENPDAAQAAQNYEESLRKFFALPPGSFPRFDLILLGMGPDGHTASLFPNGRALQERSRWVVSDRVEKFKTDRITLTLPVLNNAAEILFMVSGSDKAATLKEVLEGTQPAEKFPSKLIRPVDGKVIWLVDGEAAGALSRS